MRLGAIRASIIAAAYTALTLAFASVAYGPLQFRPSELLMPLPYLYGWDAVVGLTVGAVIANVASQYGVYDVVLGALVNFLAGFLSYIVGRGPLRGTRLGRVLAVVPAIVLVPLIIGYILFHIVYDMPLLESVGYVFISEAVMEGIGGYMVLSALERRLGVEARV